MHVIVTDDWVTVGLVDLFHQPLAIFIAFLWQIKMEVKRDAVYQDFDKAAKLNAYYDKLHDFAVANGMDKHGLHFIEALDAMKVSIHCNYN